MTSDLNGLNTENFWKFIEPLTLNGKDWSNLWHINYLGGCGGETLATWTAQYNDIDVYQYKDNTYNSGFRDSYWDALLFYKHWPSDYPESYNEDLESISPIIIQRKVKILSYMAHLWGPELHTSTSYDSFEEFLQKINLLDWHDIVTTWTTSKKQMLVSHLVEQDFSRQTILKNSNLLRLLPESETADPFITLLMFYKRYMLEDWVQAEYVQYLDPEWKMLVENLKDLQNGVVYTWQRELIKNKKLKMSWQEYVDYIYNKRIPIKNFNNDYMVSGSEWVFGPLSANSKRKIETNLKISLSEFPLDEWQDKNNNIISQLGYSTSMSLTAVVEKLKDYYSNVDYPVVTDLKTIN